MLVSQSLISNDKCKTINKTTAVPREEGISILLKKKQMQI
jgi:hypothetical protein